MRVAGALLFFTTAAVAEPAVPVMDASVADRRFTFEWQAPDGCPTESAVLARAEQLVGHRLTPASGTPPIALFATVPSPVGSSWQMRVTSGAGAAGARTVNATSCDELGEAMALLIALSIEPDYVARPAAPSGASPSSVPPHAAFLDAPSAPEPPPLPAAPAPAPEPVRHPAPRRSAASSARPESPIHGAVSGSGAVWVGRLPGVAPGGVLRGALLSEPFVLSLELGFFPMQHAEAQGVGGKLWLGTLGGSLGYALFGGLVTPSAGVELDLLRGVGQGVSTPESAGVWLLGLDGGVLFRYPPRSAVSVLAAGTLSVLAEQASFRIDPDVPLFHPARVGAQFGLGAELTIR